MPTTQAELTWARSYIGNTETEDVFNERFDRLSLEYVDREIALSAAVEESLRAQLAAMLLDGPSQASLPGGISFSVGANIQTLASELETFRAQLADDISGGGGGNGFAVARLVRQRKR